MIYRTFIDAFCHSQNIFYCFCFWSFFFSQKIIFLLNVFSIFFFFCLKYFKILASFFRAFQVVSSRKITQCHEINKYFFLSSFFDSRKTFSRHETKKNKVWSVFERRKMFSRRSSRMRPIASNYSEKLKHDSFVLLYFFCVFLFCFIF